MKCDVCDEEFDTDNQLAQHKALMHAGESPKGDMPDEKPVVDAREIMMPRPEDEMPDSEKDDELEAPDYPKAANE